jgi:hypothetical protein
MSDEKEKQAALVAASQEPPSLTEIMQEHYNLNTRELTVGVRFSY